MWDSVPSAELESVDEEKQEEAGLDEEEYLENGVDIHVLGDIFSNNLKCG